MCGNNQTGAAAAGGGPDWRMNTSMMSTEAPFAILVAMTLPDPPNYGRIIIAVILAGIGLFNIVRPRTAWFLDSGWKYKDAEPSDMALSRPCNRPVFWQW